MNRRELEHAIRAACDALGTSEVIVVGSQAILGEFPDAPRELRQSAEADIWVAELAEEEVEQLNSLGFGSDFHIEFGFFLDPVGPGTALMPPDWRTRAITVTIPDRDVRGVCPEAHDLAISKLARGDEKDLEFVAAMLFHRMIRERFVRQRLESMPDLADDARIGVLQALEVAARKARERRTR